MITKLFFPPILYTNRVPFIQEVSGVYTSPFLTRELRMRNTSYREFWENVSLARWAVNIMQMRYARGLLLRASAHNYGPNNGTSRKIDFAQFLPIRLYRTAAIWD